MRNIFFYQLFFAEKDVPYSNSVKAYLQNILDIPYQKRIVDIDGYPVVLSLNHIEPMTKLNLYTMVRFKNDSHIFKGSLTDESLEEIKGDIAQLTTFLFDEKSNIMVEEYNHEGIKHKDILKYLNAFLGEEEKRKLHSIQINENYSIETIKGSTRIASIEVKLKLDKVKLNLLKEENSKFAPISSIFDKEASDTLEADFASIVFRKGRKSTLNVESVINFLRLLNVEDESIQAVTVQFKYRTKMVSMDLKNIDKPLRDQILEESTMKNPFLNSIRDGLVMLYIDKHAGRFDFASEQLIGKMKADKKVYFPLPLYRQREMNEWVAE